MLKGVVETPPVEPISAYFSELGRALSAVRVSDAELAAYSIEGDSAGYSLGYGKKFGDTLRNKGYYDCPYAFCLLESDRPIAVISFGAIYGGIIIRQIQATERIDHLKWERALVAYVEDFARRHNLSKVCVLASKNNSWPQIAGKSEPGESGYMHYDVTARRMGFKKDPETGNYVKLLGPELPMHAIPSPSLMDGQLAGSNL